MGWFIHALKDIFFRNLCQGIVCVWHSFILTFEFIQMIIMSNCRKALPVKQGAMRIYLQMEEKSEDKG
jgi:hypothetical protein